MSTYRRKLIEVALPLAEINEACHKDKNRKTGHIRNVHKWFAPMPLPAWRAMLLASVIDDPSNDMPEEQAAEARKHLFDLIKRTVPLDACHDDALMGEIRAAIVSGTNGTPPVVVDPFCGGGSTLVEAARLGFDTVGSDLNPIPVMISTAVSVIPRRFQNRPPISKALAATQAVWTGLDGFKADVRRYAEGIRARAMDEIGNLYPPGPGGEEILAWRWAWSVESPDPAARGKWTPLVTDWRLARSKSGHGMTVIRPEIGEGATPQYSVQNSVERPVASTNRNGATCVFTDTPIPHSYIREQGRGGKMRLQLLALVGKEGRRRVYIPPNAAHELAATEVSCEDFSDIELPPKALGFRVQQYGFKTFGDLFTTRQKKAVQTFARLVDETYDFIIEDSNQATSDSDSDPRSLAMGGDGARAYAEAITAVLGLAVGKLAQSNNVLVRWFVDPRSGGGKATPAFDRHAVPMVWDFVETNPFGGSVGDWTGPVLDTILGGFSLVATQATGDSIVTQLDARDVGPSLPSNVLVATDPPYYDNIGYADLSDFFYFVERPALKRAFPDLFRTIATPKNDELIATPHRHASSQLAADEYFRNGFMEVFARIAHSISDEYPILIVYALKQSEGDQGSSGWETFLGGLLDAGLTVVATWPVRTTTATRMISLGTNALASAIYVVCRKRSTSSATVSRREFQRLLLAKMPAALRALQEGNIAPVDLPQSSIGPGIALFSQHKAVIEADGSSMSVRTALQLINQVLDEIMGEEEAGLDRDTRFAITWFDNHKYDNGPFGEADNLARARNVSVTGVEEAGILHSAAGLVRLLTRPELPEDWDPRTDKRLTIWEATQHLIKRLEEKGEVQAASLLQKLGPVAEQARNLAYRLFAKCERHGLADEARAYNGLVIAWPEIERLAANEVAATASSKQSELFD